MRSLEKWQFISFISRMSAMVFGIVQSFLILRILSVSEWGLVQLVVSIGSALGIYQHLGLASASNREIAASKDNKAVFKIFSTTLMARYLVTTPLSIGLFLLAPKISQTYGFVEILLPLRIFAFVIFLQGSQAITNAVISGTKRFKELFIFQVVIALISVLIYVPFVYYFKIMGFFYAFFLHELLKTFSLFIIAFKPYLNAITLPSRDEFVKIFRELFSLGIGIYIVKILVINWEKLGTNLLGFVGDAELIGIYSFALLYAHKLMHVSDAITDVNLPVFSEKFVHDINSFRDSFAQNFNRIYAMIIFFAMSAIYWAPQLITVLIGSDKYDKAIPLLIPMVFAYVFFSMINIFKSSLAIPAKLVREMILGFFIMFIATLLFYFSGRNFSDPLIIMSYAMVIGAGLGFSYLVFILQKNLKFKFISYAHVLLLIQALAISYMGSITNLYIKFGAYFLFVVLFLWFVLLAKFVTKEELKLVIRKTLSFREVLNNEKA
jgi:O-antigen/teichoic acid export membrane protein